MDTGLSRVLARWSDGRPPEACAHILGVSPNTLRNWMTGEVLPPATRIPALAASMGVGEARLRQTVARDRANRDARHAPHGAPDPADAIATNGVVQ